MTKQLPATGKQDLGIPQEVRHSLGSVLSLSCPSHPSGLGRDATHRAMGTLSLLCPQGRDTLSLGQEVQLLLITPLNPAPNPTQSWALLGVSWAGPGAGLDDPLPTEPILCFSEILETREELL